MAVQIVSASRRTDIPAFYSEWLLNRLQAGYCLTVNPFNSRQVTRVELTPGDTVLVLWTRDPRPLLPAMAVLDPFPHYFLFTLTAYPRRLEPGLPPLEDRLAAFRRLAARLGPGRVIWRYDPIILTREMDAAFHREAFTGLARALAGSTRRVIVSPVELYPRVRRQWEETVEGETAELVATLAAVADRHGLHLQTCASGEGPPGRCVDDGLIRELFGLTVAGGKDPGQRPGCRCVRSRDIGAYDTCLHGCAYCYATRHPVARRHHARHDPRAPWLLAPGGE